MRKKTNIVIIWDNQGNDKCYEKKKILWHTYGVHFRFGWFRNPSVKEILEMFSDESCPYEVEH